MLSRAIMETVSPPCYLLANLPSFLPYASEHIADHSAQVLSKPARASSTHVAETITASVIPILVFKWFAEVARCHSLMCASLRIELANKPNGKNGQRERRW